MLQGKGDQQGTAGPYSRIVWVLQLLHPVTEWSFSKALGYGALLTALFGFPGDVKSQDLFEELFGSDNEPTTPQVRRPVQRARPTSISASYSVEGLAVGGRIVPGSKAYRAYDCHDSELYKGFIWCRKHTTGHERRGGFAADYSILHDGDGVVSYVSRIQSPAYFAPNEIPSLKSRLSEKFGPIAQTQEIEWNDRRQHGVFYVWGAARLEPLGADERSDIAQDTGKKHGLLVDFISDFKASARLGLPIYRITGGPGFVWIASFDKTGEGQARYFAANANGLPQTEPSRSAMGSSISSSNMDTASNSRFVAGSGAAGLTAGAVRQSLNSKSEANNPATESQNILSTAPTKKVALVIGNNDYISLPKLQNPRNDAEDISKSLQEMGFTVYRGLDATRAQMSKLVKDFSKELTNASVAVVYYAGHGVQQNGENYLLPVDLEIKSDSSLNDGSLQLSVLQSELTNRNSALINIIVLDACRNNPIPEILKSAGDSRGIGELSRGLAEPKSGLDTIIVFSTAPSQVASDGDGRNSPFAEALLSHVKEPDIDVEIMFRKVFHDVQKKTDGKQIPWKHGNLTNGINLLSTRQATDTSNNSNLSVLAPKVGADVETVRTQTSIPDQRAFTEAIECDRLAGNIYDARKPQAVIGSTYEALRANSDGALSACSIAVERYPDDLRYRYQYARSLQVKNPNAALPLLRDLMNAGYPVAADNFGWAMLDRRVHEANLTDAVNAFRRGVQLGDSSSMVSLASLMIRGSIQPAFQNEHISLLERAAALGHFDAQEVLLKLKAQLQQSETERRQNEQAARMFLGIVGGLMGAAVR